MTGSSRLIVEYAGSRALVAAGARSERPGLLRSFHQRGREDRSWRWLGLASPRRRFPACLHSVLTFAAAITLPPNFSVSSTKIKNCGRSAFRKGSLADQPLKFTIVGGLTTAAGSHHRSGRCASP